MTNIISKLKEKTIKARNDVEWEKSSSPYQMRRKERNIDN